MRPINLIPKEERRSHGDASRTGPLAYIVVGALAVLLIGIVMLVLTSNRISDREGEVESLQSQKAAASARADVLQPYVSFQQVAQQRTQTVVELADSRFDWARVIRQLSLVLPPRVFVTNLTAKGSTSSEGTGTVTGPSLEVTGCAPSQDAVAAFVASVKQIDGVTRVGLSTSSIGEGDGGGGEEGGCEAGASFALTVVFDEAPAQLGAIGVEAEVPPVEGEPEGEPSEEESAEGETTESEPSSEGEAEAPAEGTASAGTADGAAG